MAYENPLVPTVNFITRDPNTNLLIEGEVNGVPPAGAAYGGIFSLNCELIRTDISSGTYINTGTVAVPVWTLDPSGGGIPGLPFNSIQYNNTGTFGGSANNIWDDVNNRIVTTEIIVGPINVEAFPGAKISALADSGASIIASRALSGAPGAFGGISSQGTLAAPTSSLSGDILAVFAGAGYDSFNVLDAVGSAFMIVSVDGAPGVGFVPAQLIFGTKNSAGVPVNRMYMRANGFIGVNQPGPVGTEIFGVTGDVYMSGKLTVLGAIDPTSVLLSGGTALYYESNDGSTAPLSGGSTGRIRYNNLTGKWQISTQGGVYDDIVTGAGNGITSINTDITAAQTLTTGAAGTDFAIVDNLTGDHLFNLPIASAVNTGKLLNTDWTTFNNKQPAGNYITDLTGDGTATGPGSVALTLATVNADVGSWGTATQVGQFTVNGKGLITAASNILITPDAANITGGQALTEVDDTNVTLTLGGTPATALLKATSLTLGWTGALAETRGGTNQITYATGDTLYASAPNVLSKLPIGLAGQQLTVVAGIPAWAAASAGGTVTGIIIATANGLAGTSDGNPATPTLTLSTTVTGLLKGNGTAISAAVGGVDYEFPLTFSAPLVRTVNAISITQSGVATDGYLSSVDWNTFNNKQVAGAYITALTGDVTATGPGSVAATIANDAVTFAKFQNITSNRLLGRATVGSGDMEEITLGTNLSFTGTTLNAAGSGGTVTSVSVVTNQGVSGVVATPTTTPAITLSLGALTGVISFNGLIVTANTGVITTGIWNGTAITEVFGGTNQTTYATGDILYASGVNTLSKLPIGTPGQQLTVVAGIPAWSSGGTGTVTSFSAGTLSPLFTTAVATPTTTPALSFTLSTAAANTWFGNNTGGVLAPVYNVSGALTKVDDTNVTLTLGGSPTTALLNAASLTLGWTGLLSLARGGTNKNITASNGAVVWCDADSFELTTVGTSGQFLKSNGAAAPTWVNNPGAITDTVSLTGQVADIADTAFSVAAPGLFRVSYYLMDTTADATAGKVTLNIKYTDNSGAKVMTSFPVKLSDITDFAGQSMIVRLNSGSITYGTTHTGSYGTSQYALYVTLERLI